MKDQACGPPAGAVETLFRGSLRASVVTIFAVLILALAACSEVAAQGKFKPGDRVECDGTETGKYWDKATVIDFKPGDVFNGFSADSGYFYRVRLVGFEQTEPDGRFCKAAHMRQVAAAAAAPQTTTGVQTVIEPPRDQGPPADGNPKYKVGDRVECDITGSGKWFEKGTIAPFPAGDMYNGYRPESGYYYRVKLDRRAAGGTVQVVVCKDNVTTLRPLAGGAQYKPETTEIPIGKITVDENNTLSADRPILECPVQQPKARNGERPNAGSLKRVLRCRLGEKPADRGLDGAVTIDVTAIQVGAPRPWDHRRDMGGGTPGVTTVYPVKATYTQKTFYRGQTVVGENWIAIFNFFVNGFGEWQYGSADTIKMPDNKNIPREEQ